MSFDRQLMNPHLMRFWQSTRRTCSRRTSRIWRGCTISTRSSATSSCWTRTPSSRSCSARRQSSTWSAVWSSSRVAPRLRGTESISSLWRGSTRWSRQSLLTHTSLTIVSFRSFQSPTPSSWARFIRPIESNIFRWIWFLYLRCWFRKKDQVYL